MADMSSNDRAQRRRVRSRASLESITQQDDVTPKRAPPVAPKPTRIPQRTRHSDGSSDISESSSSDVTRPARRRNRASDSSSNVSMTSMSSETTTSGRSSSSYDEPSHVSSVRHATPDDVIENAPPVEPRRRSRYSRTISDSGMGTNNVTSKPTWTEVTPPVRRIMRSESVNERRRRFENGSENVNQNVSNYKTPTLGSTSSVLSRSRQRLSNLRYQELDDSIYVTPVENNNLDTQRGAIGQTQRHGMKSDGNDVTNTCDNINVIDEKDNDSSDDVTDRIPLAELRHHMEAFEPFGQQLDNITDDENSDDDVTEPQDDDALPEYDVSGTDSEVDDIKMSEDDARSRNDATEIMMDVSNNGKSSKSQNVRAR